MIVFMNYIYELSCDDCSAGHAEYKADSFKDANAAARADGWKIFKGETFKGPALVNAKPGSAYYHRCPDCVGDENE